MYTRRCTHIVIIIHSLHRKHLLCVTKSHRSEFLIRVRFNRPVSNTSIVLLLLLCGLLLDLRKTRTAKINKRRKHIINVHINTTTDVYIISVRPRRLFDILLRGVYTSDIVI